MVTDKIIAEAITKLVDSPYFLGDESKGWDCLNSLKEFYEDCGFAFPRRFEDWEQGNYRDKWVFDPEVGREVFYRFLKTLGKQVDLNYAVRGDLLLLKTKVERPVTETLKRRVLNRIKETHPFMHRFINNVLAGRSLLTWPAIYIGNGKIFMIFEKGGKIIPLKPYEHFIEEVRRLF
jgi:hypothetical protein